MMQISKSKMIKLLSALFILALLFFGCASSGGGNGGDESEQTDTDTDVDSDTDTDTDADSDTDEDSDTDTDTDADSDADKEFNFSGDYTLYNEFIGCLYQFVNFDISIELRGSDAVMTALGQTMDCQVLEEELKCNGAIDVEYIPGYGNIQFEFTNFVLRAENGGLVGESEYSAVNENGDSCDGQVAMTSIRPDYGSLFIANRSDATYEGWTIRSCGDTEWEVTYFDPPLSPGTASYYHPIDIGCYDLGFCQTIEGSDSSDCWGGRFLMKAANTTVVTIFDSDSSTVSTLNFDSLNVEKTAPYNGIYKKVKPVEISEHMPVVEAVDSPLFLP